MAIPILLINLQMLDFDEDEDNQYQLVNVTPTSSRSCSSLNLPDGWIVEYVPRRSGDHVDRVISFNLL